MRAFAEAFPDEEIVQQLVAQLPWGHNVKLIEALKGSEERLWYARQAVEHGWSRNVLVQTLTFFRLPRQHHKHLKSTNMLERLNVCDVHAPLIFQLRRSEADPRRSNELTEEYLTSSL